MILRFFQGQKRRELRDLQLKSHFVKSLGMYMHFSYDIFIKTKELYPDFDFATIIENKADATKQSLNIIHASMERFHRVAGMIGVKTKLVDRAKLDKWMYIYPDEYEAAMGEIVKHIKALKKKAEEMAKA